MLDMSKAFDTVDQTMLLEDLRPHNRKRRTFYDQMFARSRTVSEMRKNRKVNYSIQISVFHKHYDHTYPSCTYKTTKITPPFILEHSYHQHVDNHIRIDQEYADDLSKITTDPHTIEYYKNTLPLILATRNLQINESQTEEYMIKRKGDESWKDCKLLGSLLDTGNDIKRRKGLAIGAINRMKHIFYSNEIDIKN